jgi:hypothetical protein
VEVTSPKRFIRWGESSPVKKVAFNGTLQRERLPLPVGIASIERFRSYMCVLNPLLRRIRVSCFEKLERIPGEE